MKSKREMLREMEREGWEPETDKNSPYPEVLGEYLAFLDEIDESDSLFPNGRDYDAEDEG